MAGVPLALCCLSLADGLISLPLGPGTLPGVRESELTFLSFVTPSIGRPAPPPGTRKSRRPFLVAEGVYFPRRSGWGA